MMTLAAIALTGCAVRISSGTGGGAASASASFSTASPLATAVVVGVMAADTVHYYSMGPDGKTLMYRAPAPDPTRTINAQDCTKPVDFSAGNLMCR
jgi:hypothetical protein